MISTSLRVRDTEEGWRNTFLLKNPRWDNGIVPETLGKQKGDTEGNSHPQQLSSFENKTPTCYCFSLSVGGDARNKAASPLVRQHEGKCMCVFDQEYRSTVLFKCSYLFCFTIPMWQILIYTRIWMLLLWVTKYYLQKNSISAKNSLLNFKYWSSILFKLETVFFLIFYGCRFLLCDKLQLQLLCK